MAPKKKANKGGKGGDDEGPDQAEMNGILEAHVDSLKQKLVMQQERMNASMAKQEKIQTLEVTMDSDMQGHKVQTQEMVKSMTGTYKDMERGLTQTIEKHETHVQEQEEQKTKLKQDI